MRSGIAHKLTRGTRAGSPRARRGSSLLMFAYGQSLRSASFRNLPHAHKGNPSGFVPFPKRRQIPSRPCRFRIFVLISTPQPPCDKQGGFESGPGKVCRREKRNKRSFRLLCGQQRRCPHLERATEMLSPFGKGNRDVVPLWKRGIKGDFRIMIYKSPLTPLFQRGEPIEKPEEPNKRIRGRFGQPPDVRLGAIASPAFRRDAYQRSSPIRVQNGNIGYACSET